MNLIEIRELYKNQEAYLDKEITVGGWVRSIRDSKAFGFIVINDGTFFTPLQVVYHDDMENFEEISKLNVGAAVVVTGTLVATPQDEYCKTARRRSYSQWTKESHEMEIRRQEKE